MNAIQNYIDSIEEQYKENLWKMNIGIWSNQQWYDYCTMVLGDLMNIQDKTVRNEKRQVIEDLMSLEAQGKISVTTYDDMGIPKLSLTKTNL
jgi:hypothetical protein